MRRFDRLADNERRIREVNEEAELIARDDHEREGHRRSQEVEFLWPVAVPTARRRFSSQPPRVREASWIGIGLCRLHDADDAPARAREAPSRSPAGRPSRRPHRPSSAPTSPSPCSSDSFSTPRLACGGRTPPRHYLSRRSQLRKGVKAGAAKAAAPAARDATSRRKVAPARRRLEPS